MVTQYVVILVICVATISMLFLVSRQKSNAGRARMESEARKEHEEQTRMMTQRLADTGTEWRVAQDEANAKPDPEELVDQSIEAQFDRQ